MLQFLSRSSSIIPLVFYRVTFGILMCFSTLRFLYKGWIEACYVDPEFHFTYQCFEWVSPVQSIFFMYFLVILLAILALFIALGFCYRFVVVLFFLLFTYLEMIEKSWYLNHHYFVSLISFILLFLPANQYLSLDTYLFKKRKRVSVPYWTIFVLKLQISLVYFLAGLAKLKPSWLLEAMPLKLWLKEQVNLPIIGGLFTYDTTAYIFSYLGIMYDLLIPFLLWNKKTRYFGLICVVLFHSMTGILFNIGLFPIIMIIGSLIFLDINDWKRIGFSFEFSENKKSLKTKTVIKVIFVVFFTFQLLFPFRYLLYNENTLWTERHYRFSWNVMLMEKHGSVVFLVKDKVTGKIWREYPSAHLDPIQEKNMSHQADMIYEYALFLKEKYTYQGYNSLSIYSKVYVTLNGSPSQLFLPEELNLLTVDRNTIYNHIIDQK